MDPLYAYLQLTPENLKLFKETNHFHPHIIKLLDEINIGFAIVIEDFEKGTYRLVNSTKNYSSISNEHFEPNLQQPLKTIGDLDNLIKIFNGIGLTISAKPYRNCPNCNHSNTKEESCNKYVCKYCSGD